MDEALFRMEVGRPPYVPQAILSDVFARLEPAAHFRGEVGAAFRLLVEKTLQFLADRHNLSRLTADDVEYLFKPDDGKPMIKERAVQKDYVRSLKMSEIGWRITPEVPEISGGRVDVYVNFDNFRFVVEIKREMSDVSRGNVRRYLGQSVLYQSTDVKLGLLLVLDLLDKSSGWLSLDESMWVDSAASGPSDTIRHVVVAIIPGNRPRPSDVVTSEHDQPSWNATVAHKSAPRGRRSKRPKRPTNDLQN